MVRGMGFSRGGGATGASFGLKSTMLMTMVVLLMGGESRE